MYHKHIDVSKYTPQIPFPQGGGQRRTMNDEQDIMYKTVISIMETEIARRDK